jgi:Leucine-rich repeat (LRR) protein
MRLIPIIHNYSREVLIIQCEKLASLNTTYITVPDSLMTNVVSVEIIFDKTGITQITSPFLPKKLSNLLRNFYIQGSNIEKIDANVFDGIKLERLDLSGNNIGDSALNNG